MKHPDESQFSGCLIGQCLGDALGFIVEGQSTRVCQRYVQEIMNTGKVIEHSRGPFPFGQYSDDSQLARELLQSIVSHGRFDPSDYASRIAAIFAENRIVGRGRATDTAARRLAQGISWEETGTPPPSAGNGSAMRAAPIGLFFYDDPVTLIHAAHDQGRITHQDPRCSAGAIAIAGAVSLVLQETNWDTQEFTGRLSDWVYGYDPILATALQDLSQWVSLPPEEAVIVISKVGLPPGYKDAWEGISPFVTTSVLWSLYAFLRHMDNYWAAISTAIGVGGDVDTTAAMTGAISGASLGLESIPIDLATYLNDRGTWRFEQLVSLALDCYKLKVGL